MRWLPGLVLSKGADRRCAVQSCARKEAVLLERSGIAWLEENTMTTPGTILIENAALRPQCFQLKDESFPDGRMAVRHNLSSHELEEELSGWTFFYMAGAIRTTAFGLSSAENDRCGA